MDTTEIDPILRMPSVELVVGFKRSHIYNLEKTDPTFPKRVALGPRSVGWRQSEINAWLSSREQKEANK